MIDISVINDESSVVKAPSPTVIKIIGCGGGGSSAVNRMISAGVSDVEFIVLNTDVQALNISKAQKKLAIGHQLTGGLGAGGNPAVGENAAKEDTELITNVVKGADMVIITAGMGGGTGTGSAPIVAQIAREQGALTIAVVTTPFEFEGSVRMRNARDGLKKLRQNIDSLIIIPNQQVMKIIDKKITYRQAFRLADDVLCQGVQGISEIITKPGEVNIDFADVTAVMKNKGDAILGVGIAEGENRAVEAAQKAITNPMLENRHIDGARYILVNITSAEDLAMTEVEEIVNNIRASANKDLSLYWGQALDPEMGQKISVTVIATGFDDPAEEEAKAAQSSKKPADSNIMSYGDFMQVINGKSVFDAERAAEREAAENPPEKVSTIPLSAEPAAYADEAEDVVDKSVLVSEKKEDANVPLSETLRRAIAQNRGIEPPTNFTRNPDDLNQPAVWRNRNLKDLPRSINLTDN